MMSAILDIGNNSYETDFTNVECSGSKILERSYDNTIYQINYCFNYFNIYKEIIDFPLKSDLSSILFKIDWGDWNKSKLIDEKIDTNKPELVYNIPIKLGPNKRTKVKFKVVNKKKGKFCFKDI